MEPGTDPLKDLYDISAQAHDAELWRLPHRVTCRSSLTQDFDIAADGGAPTPRPAYRASISVPIQVTSVEIWASEEVTLTINGATHTIDKVKTANVTPSLLSKLSISIPATEIGCPTLFLRTNLMRASDPPHIVTPDVEVHRKIGALPDGAMYAARGQLGISSTFDDKPNDVASVQKAVQNLTCAVQYSYNDTYHGVHHDRGVLPANMEHQHFALDFSTGGATYSPLTRQQVIESTQTARRISGGAAQSFGDDFLAGLKQASTIIVHTADAIGNVAVDTASRASKGLSQAVSAVGEDLVHGDLLKAGSDLFTGGENLGKTLAVGASTAVADAAQGAKQVLVITLKLGTEAIQVVIDETASLGKAVNSLLDKIGILVGKFVGWLLDNVGWADVLHTQTVLLDSLNTRLSQAATFLTDAKEKADDFFKQQTQGAGQRNRQRHVSLWCRQDRLATKPSLSSLRRDRADRVVHRKLHTTVPGLCALDTGRLCTRRSL